LTPDWEKEAKRIPVEETNLKVTDIPAGMYKIEPFDPNDEFIPEVTNPVLVPSKTRKPQPPQYKIRFRPRCFRYELPKQVPVGEYEVFIGEDETPIKPDDICTPKRLPTGTIVTLRQEGFDFWRGKIIEKEIVPENGGYIRTDFAVDLCPEIDSLQGLKFTLEPKAVPYCRYVENVSPLPAFPNNGRVRWDNMHVGKYQLRISGSGWGLEEIVKDVNVNGRDSSYSLKDLLSSKDLASAVPTCTGTLSVKRKHNGQSETVEQGTRVRLKLSTGSSKILKTLELLKKCGVPGVEALTQGIKTDFEAGVNEGGRASFTDLLPGEYECAVQLPGKQTKMLKQKITVEKGVGISPSVVEVPAVLAKFQFGSPPCGGVKVEDVLRNASLAPVNGKFVPIIGGEAEVENNTDYTLVEDTNSQWEIELKDEKGRFLKDRKVNVGVDEERTYLIYPKRKERHVTLTLVGSKEINQQVKLFPAPEEKCLSDETALTMTNGRAVFKKPLKVGRYILKLPDGLEFEDEKSAEKTIEITPAPEPFEREVSVQVTPFSDELPFSFPKDLRRQVLRSDDGEEIPPGNIRGEQDAILRWMTVEGVSAFEDVKVKVRETRDGSIQFASPDRKQLNKDFKLKPRKGRLNLECVDFDPDPGDMKFSLKLKKACTSDPEFLNKCPELAPQAVWTERFEWSKISELTFPYGTYELKLYRNKDSLEVEATKEINIGPDDCQTCRAQIRDSDFKLKKVQVEITLKEWRFGCLLVDNKGVCKKTGYAHFPLTSFDASVQLESTPDGKSYESKDNWNTGKQQAIRFDDVPMGKYKVIVKRLDTNEVVGEVASVTLDGDSTLTLKLKESRWEVEIEKKVKK